MITISKQLSILLLSTLAVAAAPAAEQDKPASSAEETFKALDRDSDQRLSKSEAAKDKSLARTFAYLDADGDGYITLREYTALYGLTARRADLLPEHALVMHPGPMNRGVEIAAEVADRPGAVIVDQVRNGVAVRMAVLFLLLGSGTEFGGDGNG